LVKDSKFESDKKTTNFNGLKNHLGPFGLNPAFNDYMFDPLDKSLYIIDQMYIEDNTFPEVSFMKFAIPDEGGLARLISKRKLIIKTDISET
jgi:hypothetical protein